MIFWEMMNKLNKRDPFTFLVFMAFVLCGFSQNSISDSIFIEHVKQLNSKSQIRIPYNSNIKKEASNIMKSGSMAKKLGLSAFYFSIFEKELKKNGLPDELKYIPVIESALNSRAISPAGAMGLWQIMPQTGKSYGLINNSEVNTFFDPYISTNAAIKILQKLYKEFGTWELALVAYNCGPGRLKKLILKHKENNVFKLLNYLPVETQNYLVKFWATYYVFKFKAYYRLPKKRLAINPEKVIIVVNQERKEGKTLKGVFRFLNPHLTSRLIPKNCIYYEYEN